MGQFSAEVKVGGREGVTWLPDSCIECRPAVGLLPVRVCVEEIEGKEGREKGRNTVKQQRDVVCSGAIRRGLDDASRKLLKGEREAETE